VHNLQQGFSYTCKAIEQGYSSTVFVFDFDDNLLSIDLWRTTDTMQEAIESRTRFLF
jgi:hypothetical protein